MLAFHYRPNYSVEPYAPPTWADGTDEEIAEAVAKADAGEINLSDYWAVGDTRSVDIASFSGNSTATHVAQTVEVVLMHEGLYQTTDNKTVNFVVGLKNLLANGTTREDEKMNSSDTNNGSWRDSLMRTLCNGNLYSALPQWLRDIMKTVKVTTGVYYYGQTAGGTNIVTEDKVFLAAEKEVQGSKKYSTDNEAGALTQFTYYTTAANKIKKAGASGNAGYWWLRSSYYSNNNYFCAVGSTGSAGYRGASIGYGLAPCMCI